MSNPLGAVYHGDLTIEQGCNSSAFGLGDLRVSHNAYILGTDNSTNFGSGALTIIGGVGVGKDTNLGGMLTVSSTSSLQTTYIDTSLGLLNISGANSVLINVNSASSFITQTGDLTLYSSAGSMIIKGGLNADSAVQLIAQNVAGGINLLSGQNGKVELTGGIGGIQALTSAGNINLTANNGSGSFVVNSLVGNQNLEIKLNGSTNSQLLLQSSGINTTIPAILINTTNTNGNIQLSNNGGLSNGSITNNAGSGGYYVNTNTGGTIGLTASAAPSYFIVNTTSANQNLLIGVNGATNSKLILESAGTNSTDAILIQTTNIQGSILIKNPLGSSGQVGFYTGSGGFETETQIGGGINLLANGAGSSFINQTTNTGQDLTICVQGTSANSLILCSQASGPNAIILNASGSGGGINANAVGPININSTDTVNGINIGTTSIIPVNIGSTTSVTTINGDLNVKGITTSIDSIVIELKDNIIEVNSGPTFSANGGMSVKRYQPSNNSCLGDVVADTAHNFNAGVYNTNASTGSLTTFYLEQTGPYADIAPNNFYNGWWMRIISGTGACQVRRIKNNINGIVTIYSSIEQTNILQNPIPVEGMDFLTIPDNTSVYALYPCYYVMSIWDESLDEWSMVCANYISPNITPNIIHYIDLHINNLIANNINAVSINNIPADNLLTVTLTDNSTAPISLTNFPSNCGVYILMIRPTTDTSNRTHAIFMIGRLCSAVCGVVVRNLNVSGVNGEQLDMSWPSSSFPELYYRVSVGTATQTSYNIRIMTV